MYQTVRLDTFHFATPWTVAYQDLPSVGIFPGMSPGVGLRFPSPGDLLAPGTEPGSPAL